MMRAKEVVLMVSPVTIMVSGLTMGAGAHGGKKLTAKGKSCILIGHKPGFKKWKNLQNKKDHRQSQWVHNNQPHSRPGISIYRAAAGDGIKWAASVTELSNCQIPKLP